MANSRKEQNHLIPIIAQPVEKFKIALIAHVQNAIGNYFMFSFRYVLSDLGRRRIYSLLILNTSKSEFSEMFGRFSVAISFFIVAITCHVNEVLKIFTQIPVSHFNFVSLLLIRMNRFFSMLRGIQSMMQ